MIMKSSPPVSYCFVETAHRVGIAAARFGLFPKDTRPDPELLKVQLWGRTFRNPIGRCLLVFVFVHLPMRYAGHAG